VLHNIKDVPCSFAMFMGVIYCVNLEYPKAMKDTFVSSDSGDEDQTGPSLCPGTRVKNPNPEERTVTCLLFPVL